MGAAHCKNHSPLQNVPQQKRDLATYFPQCTNQCDSTTPLQSMPSKNPILQPQFPALCSDETVCSCNVHHPQLCSVPSNTAARTNKVISIFFII